MVDLFFNLMQEEFFKVKISANKMHTNAIIDECLHLLIGFFNIFALLKVLEKLGFATNIKHLTYINTFTHYINVFLV